MVSGEAGEAHLSSDAAWTRMRAFFSQRMTVSSNRPAVYVEDRGAAHAFWLTFTVPAGQVRSAYDFARQMEEFGSHV